MCNGELQDCRTTVLVVFHLFATDFHHLSDGDERVSADLRRGRLERAASVLGGVCAALSRSALSHNI